MSQWFMVHDGVADAARVPPLARSRQHISALEMLVLLASGAAAACAVGMAKLGLGIPGHSIVLAAFPVALGLSLAPRHLAGSIMSTGALGTAWLLQRGAFGDFGSGSFVSLCLLGPLMDLALRGARRGWRVYAASSQWFDSRGANTVQTRGDGFTTVDLGFTQTLARHYDLAFDVTNLFDELYEQAYALPREGRAAVLTLRVKVN